MTDSQRHFFEAKIRPALVTHCYECHAADSKKLGGKLQLDSPSDMLTGGQSGPALIPGDPDSSLLLQALRYDGLEMPPSKPLPPTIIADFEQWIRMGAPDPRPSGPTTAKPSATADLASLWAYQARQSPPTPAVSSVAWPRSSIDSFILAAMERAHRQREIELENERLRELLGFKQSLAQPAAAARIVAKDPSSWFNTVIINQGAADGLTKGLAAVTSRGVAGQIVEVSLHQSKLMLIIDPNSAVDALIQRNRVRGIVKGTFQEECSLEFVMPEDDVRLGDSVISSGFDGVYPKGIPIGTVSAVLGQGPDFFKEVQITPAVDFNKLEEVLIILAPRPSTPAGPR
jgi:rod shape-determining protein MreC